MIKIAKTVFDREIYALDDGAEVSLAPLPIGRLKKFMKQWERFATEDGSPVDSDEAFDIYVCACGVALSKQFEDRFEDNMDAEGNISAPFKAYLEDVLDVETATKIIEICGGINLSDPKLEEMVEAAQAAAGQN